MANLPRLLLEPARASGAAGNVTETQQEIRLSTHFTTVTIKLKFQLRTTIKEECGSYCLCQLSSINLHILGTTDTICIWVCQLPYVGSVVPWDSEKFRIRMAPPFFHLSR